MKQIMLNLTMWCQVKTDPPNQCGLSLMKEHSAKITRMVQNEPIGIRNVTLLAFAQRRAGSQRLSLVSVKRKTAS